MVSFYLNGLEDEHPDPTKLCGVGDAVHAETSDKNTTVIAAI